MKRSLLTLLVLTSLFTLQLSATNCTGDSWFKYPQASAKYQEGKDVYVRVDPRKYPDIAYMDLYLNGRLVRKESSYPFEWGSPNSGGDQYLRNLKRGNYKLTVKIKDKCGNWHLKECVFIVEACHAPPPPVQCVWESWFKYPQNNQQFDYGKQVYVRVDPRKYQDIDYMELYVDGRIVRKESSYPYEWCRPNTGGDDDLRRLQPGKHKLTVKFKDKCGQWHEKYCYIYVKECHNPPTAHCEWDAWFKYPSNNGQYEYGKRVYVRVDPKKYQDIAFMELYVDGRLVRKESSYPFEWGKSPASDQCLSQLRPGYHKIKVRITDKCGEHHEKYCQIRIGHPSN